MYIKGVLIEDNTMTANNIKSARNPITGLTLAECAQFERYMETEEGQREAKAFQEYWDSLPTPDATVIELKRASLEARYTIEASTVVDKARALLIEMGIEPDF